MPEVGGGPHPLELLEAEAPVGGVLDEVRLVIPGDEPGVEYRREGRDGQECDQRGCEGERRTNVGVARCATGAVTQGTPGSRVQITIVPQGRSNCPAENCAGVVAMEA